MQAHLNATMWTYDQSTSSALAELHKLLHKRRLVIHSTTFQGVQRDFFPPAKQALTAELHILLLCVLLHTGDNHSDH